MKVLKWLLMALAGSSDRDICDTALMPDEPKFVNEIDIDAPAEKVWKVMTDTRRYAELPTRLDRVEIIDDCTWIEYPNRRRIRCDFGS